MNKADYIAFVNAKLPTGGNIPSVDHRSTMHTDPNSIGELVYKAVTDDSNALQVLTTSNANFSYTVRISKVGRHINIEGYFTFLSNVSSTFLVKVFDFSNSNYYGNGRGFGVVQGSTNSYGIRVSNDALFIEGGGFSGTQVNFNVLYNSIA